jgi:hypothetical protein
VGRAWAWRETFVLLRFFGWTSRDAAAPCYALDMVHLGMSDPLYTYAIPRSPEGKLSVYLGLQEYMILIKSGHS